MGSAPLHSAENRRLSALRGLKILDTLPESEFDEITALAAQICQAPIALISFLDEHREWFKSRFGLKIEEVAREASVGAHAILEAGVLAVEDLSRDPRFAGCSVVYGGRTLRCYAGAALFDPETGLPVGVLSVLDERERMLDDRQKEALLALSRQVSRCLRRRSVDAEKAANEERLNFALDASGVGIWDWQIDSNIVRHNRRWCAILGLDEEYLSHPVERFLDRLSDQDRPQVVARLRSCLEGGEEFYESTHRIVGSRGKLVWVRDRGRVVQWDSQGKPVRMVGSIQDITKFQEAQVHLLEAQEIAKIGSWHYNLCTGTQEWSREHYAIFEIPMPQAPSVLYGMYRDRIHPDDLPELDRFLDRAVQEGRDFVFDHRILLDDGARIKYVRGIGKVSKDASGRALAVSGTCQDLTEQVTKDRELCTILETMSEGLVIQNESGAIEKYNPEALRILGLSEEQLRGRSSMDPRWRSTKEDGTPYPGEDHPAMVALRTGQPVRNGIMGLVLPTGEERWISINAIPYQMVTDRKVAVTFADVTKHMRANREIGRFFDIAQDLLCIFGKGDRFVRLNRAVNAILGYEEADLLDTLFSELIHPEDLSKVNRILEQLRGGARPVRAVARCRSKSGDYRVLSWTLMFDSREEKIFGSASDITDEIALQASLQAERAKSIQSAKLASIGEVSAGIAHEINNPLGVISLTLSSLEKCRDDQPKFAGKVETLARSVNRIEKIVKGLKKFSRSGVTSDLKAESLNEVIAEALVIAGPKANRHSASIKVETKEDFLIECDQVEIEQVLVNLLNNAIDAVKDLPERWILVQTLRKDRGAILRVIDSGSGLSREVEEKLFQPFFTTKPVGEGTGLGLSIIKGILDRHRATISINHSFMNTCFEIHFDKLVGGQRAS